MTQINRGLSIEEMTMNFTEVWHMRSGERTGHWDAWPWICWVNS